jgi:hypothetical protein
MLLSSAFVAIHIQFTKIRGPAQFSQKGEERGPAAVISWKHMVAPGRRLVEKICKYYEEQGVQQ